MIRSYDLSIEHEVVEQLLNDPHLLLQKCRVDCGKTGYTTVTLHIKRVSEPIERKRYRMMQRFILFNGANPELDRILENENNRMINKYEFVTEQGVIIVLDYHFLVI